MDSNAPEELDSRAEFRKPSNDSTNRKYRRRSPVGGSSSSSDGSRERRHSPGISRVTSNATDDKQREDNGKNHHDRSGESYKYTDRKSSRNYHRQDEHMRRDRNADEYDQGYSKSTYRSRRDTRDDLNCPGSDKEHLRDYSRSRTDVVGHLGKDRDSYNRAGSGRRPHNIDERNMNRDRDRHREDRSERYGKTDLKRNYKDNESDSAPAHGHEVSRNQQYETSRRENSDHQKRDGSWRDAKELGSERCGNEEKRRHDDCAENNEQDNRALNETSDAMPVIGQDPVAKKSKFSPLDSTGASEQAYVTDSDVDAAKLAAMKAAELVNKNLVGSGFMSADQKKKLLWGNKKSTATDKCANQWDKPTFGDRERQEKFNKLMSLRLHWWPIVGREGRCKSGAEVGQPRRREAAGTASDGTGKAIYCWIASSRWSNSWTWPLKHNSFRLVCNVVLSHMKKLLCNVPKPGS